MATSADYLLSSYRESLLEHLFIGELLRHLWLNGVHRVEVLHSEVDGAGYDVVVECNSVMRHIQLKATGQGRKRGNVNVTLALIEKRSACVVWLFFDQETLELGPFYIFGGTPGQPMPDISHFRVARHTKGDATGFKAERPNLRLIPKGSFEKLDTMDEVVEWLFGDCATQSPAGVE